MRLALAMNNAITWVLLLDSDDTVVGAWDAADSNVWADYLADRGSAEPQWEPNYPACGSITDYGEELDSDGIAERIAFYGEVTK